MSEAKKWNSDVVWAQDSNYIIRTVEEKFGPSAGGNPMITLKHEVVSPEEMEVAGEKYNIAGVSFGLTSYHVCMTHNEDGTINPEKTADNAKRLVDLYKAYGLITEQEYQSFKMTGEKPAGINPENPTLGFKGKCVYALLQNESKEKRKSPTKAQLDAGQKQGDVMINPVTKQPLKLNMPKVSEIFGLAPEETNKPY